MVLETLATIFLKVVDLFVGPLRRRWGRRQLGHRLHTELYQIIHDRPRSSGHPPPFYRDTAADLDQAIEADLFSTHELEYLAERLAAYCRAKANRQPAKSVKLDKSFLEWTRIAEHEGMDPFDISEIDKRLRRDLEKTYRTGRFKHPVGQDSD